MKNLEKEIFEYLDAHLDPSVKRSLSTTQTSEILRCMAKWANGKMVGIAFDHAHTLARDIMGESEKIEPKFEDGENFDPDFLKELSKV